VGARTVYRHFPSRADLLQALWERVRDETKTRFRSTEIEILPLVHATFGHFSAHEAVVRAALSFSAALELRSRGSLQGRPAFR
jgi:AcrR family transcriptional regulator